MIKFYNEIATFEGGSGSEASQIFTFDFNYPVVQATSSLTGFDAQFSDGEGFEFGKLKVDLQTSIRNENVEVTVTFGLRDGNEDYKRTYQGRVSFVVMAEVDNG